MTDSTGPAETPGGVVPGGDAARRPASGQDPEGSKAQYLQLFSRELGIFARCRSAIADGTWESCRPQIEAELPLIKRYAGAAASPILGAATAVIDLTDYVIKRDSRTSLEAAAHALTRSTVAIPDPAAAARWLAASGNDLADVLPPATGQDAAVAALFGLWAAALRGDLPAEKDAVPVPALVSHQYDATVGSVCVRRLESGPGGFFPDPESIALTAFDGRFREAVRRAWQSRPMPGATVLWSVVTDNNDAFSGDSVGAALALALDELDRRAARLGRLKLRRANDRYIISAALDTNETLRGVDELDVKFDAASAAGKNVVLAELDRAQGDVEAARTSVHVDYARNLSAAIATTRRTNPLFVVICVATVILLTGLSLIGVAADHAVAAADRQAYASKLLNKVDELQNLASKAGNGTVPDRQTQALLLLAAHSLALQAGRRDIANNIVDGSVTAGAGVITSVNADLGNIHGMYAYGGDVVTTSEKGKIALIDGTTDDVLGTYTNPPGTETLNQPIVTAFAAAPHADMFAAVFQVPIPTAPVSRTATLRIFSGASRLSLVGSSVPFTARPVSAIGYSPGGDRLITVSPSTATYWDTTEPTPRIIGSCRLASPGRAAPAALLDDPKTHLPVLVESDSRVMALSSWDVTGAGQPCAESQLAGRWIGGVATPGFDAPAVTAGTTSTGGIVIAARTAGGRVGVRDLSSGRVRMLPLKARATGIGNPGQSLAVQAIGAGGRNILSQWNMADLSKPTLTATYAHHSLPAVFSDSSAFATTGGDIVDALNDQAITYPAGFVDLGPNIASNGTAAGERSFAVDYQGSIAVYTLSASRQGQFITTPAGFGLSDGDYRADSTFTISDDGRYVAAIMNVGGGSKAASPRHVFIWDVKTGTGMSVPAVLAPKAPYHRPLDIRFIPHSDDLLVNYLDGSLYRLSSDGTGWHASLIRRPTANTYNFGMDVGPGGIYLIQVPGPGSSQGSREVLRLSYTGAVLRRWNFTSLQLTAPLLAPLLDGGSLLIDSGGDAYRLHPNGIVGPGVDLSVQAALEAAQIPGTQTVLISTQGYAKVYDLAHDIVEQGNSPVGSPYGPIVTFGLTPDGRYLVASDVLSITTVLAALTPRDRTESLCQTAGREMTVSEWDAYVGGVIHYRKLCSGADAGLADFYNAARQAQYSAPPEFARTPSAGEAIRYQSACAKPGAAGFTAAGPFAWKAMASNEPVCSNGRLRWVLPQGDLLTLKPGTVAGQHVLVISGKLKSTSGPYPDTAIDVLLPESVAVSGVAPAGTVRITDSGVDLTGIQGDVWIQNVFAPDQHGYWRLIRDVPAGRA